MKLNEIMDIKTITESTDLICPNCNENLGKDTENSKKAYCGNCGNCGMRNIDNPRGHDD